MAWTNLGKQRMFEEFFCSGAIDETFRLVLCSSTGSWTASTSSDRLNFDVSSASQIGLDATKAVLQADDNNFQFSGSITAARYIVMVPAGTYGSSFTFSDGHEIYAWWDIGQEVSISAGNKLIITDLELQGQ
jgi:hypothetical protein